VSEGAADMSFSEVIKVIDFDAYKTADPQGGPLKFRVEILRRDGKRKYYGLCAGICEGV
jgi:hypothetical protein